MKHGGLIPRIHDFSEKNFQKQLNTLTDEDDEVIMSEFIKMLKSYQLFTLEARIYNKLLLFDHGIKTNAKSPVELKSSINLQISTNDSAKSDVKHTQDIYELRRGRNIVKNVILETKYETLTFKLFFPKLLKTFSNFNFSLGKDFFKFQVNTNLNEVIKIFLETFPKFDIKFTAYHPKKK